MTAHSWWTFFIATFFICSAPGPNMLMMMAGGLKHGVKRTIFIMAGCYAALLLALCVSAAGLGALLNVEPMIFNILRTIGAVYLIYIGISAWRTASIGAIDPNEAHAIAAPTRRTLLREGFLVGISNPKALLFATAFFPQFINQASPALPQFSILLITFSVIELGCYVAYACGGKNMAEHMKKDSVRKNFNRLIGILFTLFGIFLLFSTLN